MKRVCFVIFVFVFVVKSVMELTVAVCYVELVIRARARVCVCVCVCVYFGGSSLISLQGKSSWSRTTNIGCECSERGVAVACVQAVGLT